MIMRAQMDRIMVRIALFGGGMVTMLLILFVMRIVLDNK